MVHGGRLHGGGPELAEGEIDLVAVEPGDGVIVICEVKTRSSTMLGRPEEAVMVAKQRRLRRLAARWLAEHRAPLRAVRFDVAAVMADRAGELALEIVQDAFCIGWARGSPVDSVGVDSVGRVSP